MSTRTHVPVAQSAHEPVSAALQQPMRNTAHVLLSPGDHDAVRKNPHVLTSEADQRSVDHETMSAGDLDLMSSDEEGGGGAPAYVPPSRAGMKRIQGYFSPRVKRQFRLLAINTDLTEEDLVGRALNLLFKAEGLPEIAFDNKEQRRGS
ncbi:ribbon-helix-helix domain-containing protein [Hyphomicrobium sp.]|uniref:ribbon-helix-helix domain-containing protein n=1 Tax=Hyphomicrobium sp. TaxID=82 RepID=UPI002FE17CB1